MRVVSGAVLKEVLSMASSLVGIDIGTNLIKLAVCQKGRITGLYSEPVPDDLVRDGQIISYEAMSDFLKEVSRSTALQKKGALL